jgi:ribosomal protein S18 acetylase RimI-like enzyme
LIERLQSHDVCAASVVLARAFLDNPGMLAVLRGDSAERRLTVLKRGMFGFAHAVQRYGCAEVLKEDGRVRGVALSFAPGGYPPPLMAELIISVGPLLAGPRRVARFALLDQQLRSRHPPDPHWYLWMLGVEPEHQGKGVGSALLRSLAERALQDRAPCYLETDRASAMRLYQRHGFALLDEEVLPVLGARFWFMRRDQPAGGGQ